MNSAETRSPAGHAPAAHPSFAEALRFWLKLGFISFGGPTGQIAIMHTELVEKRRWISEDRFLHALNYCMLLPGPEAQQLATYVGWLLHRTWGGIAAGALFVLPSAFLLWVLSFIYAAHGSVPWIAAVFHGLKAAVIAVVCAALIRIGRKALKNAVMWTLAGLSFAAFFFFEAPFPLIIALAGIIGLVGGRVARRHFLVVAGHGRPSSGAAAAVIDDHHDSPSHARPSLARAVRVSAVCLALWWTPILLAGNLTGWKTTPAAQGLFFSKAAVVTFGGAYAVLPYVARESVENHEWLTAPQMMDGLALAETTPGPLIMVVQHVGFLGGWNKPGAMQPAVAATLGALMTTWVTFLPCFLYIFLGAPHIEQLRGNEHLTGALSAITAAVVGVVLNLAVWFGLHAVLPPEGQVDWFTLGLAVVAFAGMHRWKWDILVVIAGCGGAGLVYSVLSP
ncbi:chromate efflux transporter [Candidatus Poribacteria bacterium]|nr:chromate efflux transporter [Candidatus Poribacteria bacterium]